MTDTLFSRIIRGEIPADVVYEDEFTLAFHDINPQAPVHILIIPKKPLATLNDLDAQQVELAGRLLVTASQLAKDLGIDQSGYRTVINCNQDGGQEIYHLHVHLLGGRALRWPPG